MVEARPPRTENGAVTFAGSGNPLVDFFFQASPCPCATVFSMLETHLVFQERALHCVSLGISTAVMRLLAESVDRS